MGCCDGVKLEQVEMEERTQAMAWINRGTPTLRVLIARFRL